MKKCRSSKYAKARAENKATNLSGSIVIHKLFKPLECFDTNQHNS